MPRKAAICGIFGWGEEAKHIQYCRLLYKTIRVLSEYYYVENIVTSDAALNTTDSMQ